MCVHYGLIITDFQKVASHGNIYVGFKIDYPTSVFLNYISVNKLRASALQDSLIVSIKFYDNY